MARQVSFVYDQLKATLHNCAKGDPATQNREAHTDFRMHLLGRINWVKQLNPARGAKLAAIFEKIVWDNRSVRS